MPPVFAALPVLVLRDEDQAGGGRSGAFEWPVAVDGQKRPKIEIGGTGCQPQAQKFRSQRACANQLAVPRQASAQCTGFSASPSLMPAASSRLSRVHSVAPGARRVAASKWASM